MLRPSTSSRGLIPMKLRTLPRKVRNGGITMLLLAANARGPTLMIDLTHAPCTSIQEMVSPTDAILQVGAM